MADLPTVVLVAAGCLALALPLLAWAFTASPDAARKRALANLNRDLQAARSRLSQPQTDQDALDGLARRLTPRGGIALVERQLAAAGRPAAWPLERVLVTKLVLGAGGAVLGFLVVLGNRGALSVVMLAVLTLLGWFLPDILLYNQAIKRREAIQYALPDVLDQMTIAVEAGLGFEAALAHVGRNAGGPLGEELVRTLQDIQVGKTRRAAYEDLVDRTQVDDLKRFVRAIIQAEQHGVSVAGVLAVQAREMRVKRRQRAEEQAGKVPVKIVLPLVVFILPTLFIVILGPAVLNIIQTFAGGLSFGGLP